jgi:predicted phosphodiesterase
MAKNASWMAENVSRNVQVVKYPRGKEWWAFLATDVHWDNPRCERALFQKHLKEAKDRKACVIIAGDFFCAMQGKWDKRASKSALRPELAEKDEYLDALVDQATDWLEPFKDNLCVMGDGNHETSIKARHETDLLERLCARLRDRGSQVRHGGFSGWVRWMFNEPGGRVLESRKLFYHHGSGADPAVTKGQIEQERMASWVRGADVILLGHVHQDHYTKMRTVTLSQSNQIVKDTVHWLRAGTYQDDYGTGEAGYFAEKNRGPRPLGGWWLRFYLRNHQLKLEVTSAED